MFVEECYKAAEEFPDIIVNEVIVDTFAMRLIRDPQSFDTVVTTNMFGDILTDEAAGLVGGLGMAPAFALAREISPWRRQRMAPLPISLGRASPIPMP